MSLFSSSLTYLHVTAVNVVLSGDNVIVIAMAAAGLPVALRQKAIMAGIAAAAVIRIVLALVAVQLLHITGILLLGGLLLLWVCWNMFQELRSAGAADQHDGTALADGPQKTFRHAITQIILADVSMSLDNVLAVAGAASRNMLALVFGLTLSVLLMAVASTLIARLLGKYQWLGWLGLVIIVYIAGQMIFEGAEDLLAVDYRALFGSTPG